MNSTVSQFDKIKDICKYKRLKLNTVYGKKSDLELVDHNFKNNYQIIVIKYKSQVFKIKLNLIGKIQIKNVLMAILQQLKVILK